MTDLTRESINLVLAALIILALTIWYVSTLDPTPRIDLIPVNHEASHTVPTG